MRCLVWGGIVLGGIDADDLDEPHRLAVQRDACSPSRVDNLGEGGYREIAAPNQAYPRGRMLAIRAEGTRKEALPA